MTRLTDHLGDPDDPAVRRRWHREQPDDGTYAWLRYALSRVWTWITRGAAK